jgi:hypothetical protein
MDQVYISLLSGLVGGLIGALGSLGAVWLQGRAQDRRERMKLVKEIAIADYNQVVEAAKSHGSDFEIPSLTAFLDYHLELQKILERRELTAADIAQIRARQERVVEAMRHISKPKAKADAEGK